MEMFHNLLQKSMSREIQLRDNIYFISFRIETKCWNETKNIIDHLQPIWTINNHHTNFNFKY